MIKTVTLTVPLAWTNEANIDPTDMNELLNRHLNNGYRIKFMNTFIINNAAYAHYVLEKED